jgi:hypothetical protein
MRLTLGIIVLHILEGGECRLDGDVVALVAGVVEGEADGCGEDVWFSVLRNGGRRRVLVSRCGCLSVGV